MADTLIPDHVDARKIFTKEADIKGTLPVRQLQRLTQNLADGRVAKALFGAMRAEAEQWLEHDHEPLVRSQARQARIACSFCASGAFQKHITASPMYLSSVPSCAST